MDQQYTGLLCGRYVILPIYSFQAGVRVKLFIISITSSGLFRSGGWPCRWGKYY